MHNNKEFPIITTKVGDVEITGNVIYRSTRDINVEITSPFINVRRGLHSISFSRRLFVGEHADLTANWLLTSIYEICEFSQKNQVNLIEEMKIPKSEIRVLEELIVTLNQKKVDLKKQFRRGEISNVQYQQALKKLKRLITDNTFQISNIWSEYFKNFPMIVPYGTRDDIIKLIERL